MKMMSLILLTMFVSAHANVLKFDCQNDYEGTAFGMSVIEENKTLKAYVFGTGITGSTEVDYRVLDKNSALTVPGISHIVSRLNMSATTFNKIKTVEIFTSGNFDDDAAGVRGAHFLSKDGKLLKKGMFFGWAGPQKCF